jgi:tetraacyldisaccharide 4'-kinase
LREPLNALARASAVVLTRVEQAPPGAVETIEALVRRIRSDLPLFYARFALSGLTAIGSGGTAPLDRMAGARVVAVAGIGRFESFVELVERAGAKVVSTMRFRDHYPYRRADIDAVRARCRSVGADFAVTTEKDAVKLEALVAPDVALWAARMAVHVEDASAWSAWIDRVARLVAA